MKNIIICGSISASDEILAAQKTLEEFGYDVEVPAGVKKYVKNGHKHVSEEECSCDKKDQNLIKKYYELIKKYEEVLVVNVEKNGIKGYVGGNTFLEAGFAHVLDKKLYFLNPLPEEVSYISELEAMDTVVLNGSLENLE